MKQETETLVVLSLDRLITTIDQALDEIDEIDGLEGSSAANAERLLMTATMQINDLIDKIVEDSVEAGMKSGAV